LPTSSSSEPAYPLSLIHLPPVPATSSSQHIHNLNTHYNQNIHLPSTNLTSAQKGVLFSAGKIYNHLPSNIKALSDDAKSFKSALKNYLIEHSFYSLDEFYQSAS